jgi:pimeloyl-ACP methyl ester carboxylesterase
MADLLLHGVRYHVDDTGPVAGAPPVVFAHGLLMSGEMFRGQVEALRAHHRCVTFDWRGQGRTEVARDGYDMDTLTDDAIALITQLGAAPCHWVGLSMGGFVGLRIALRRPELLRSLSILDSAADAEPRANVPKYRAMAFFERHVGRGPLIAPVMRILFGAAFLRDPARAAERDAWRQHLLANDMSGAQRALGGVIDRRALEDDIGAITVPTLVASGEDDRAIVPARSRRTAERIPGARFVTLPRAGHSSSLEEPAAVTAALADFWSALR